MYKCKYFKLYELLPPVIYRNEDTGWELLDEKLLITLDVVREIVGKPLICNTWMQFGNRQYSGYRPKNCSIGAYNSQHKLGKAADLLCASYAAIEIRKLINNNKDKLPFPIRLERDVSWVHIDVKEHNQGKILYFNGK